MPRQDLPIQTVGLVEPSSPGKDLGLNDRELWFVRIVCARPPDQRQGGIEPSVPRRQLREPAQRADRAGILGQRPPVGRVGRGEVAGYPRPVARRDLCCER